MQIAQLHRVWVDDADAPDPGGCQIGQDRCPEPTGSDDEHMGSEKCRLGLRTETGETDLTGIACRLRWVESVS
ncbi:hypothetical protein GCM10009691_17530 [Brevibacterium picturae]|uniref:Uncharacterized protein n=1 Tax=Brevibacterium picturae TaxID=260553 RepID=A0ABP4MFQ7_9MICO